MTRICFRNTDGLACVYHARQPNKELLALHDQEIANADYDLNVVLVPPRGFKHAANSN